MCGIVGIRRFDGRPVDLALLKEMTAALGHRGPDGEGYWIDGPVGLGHRRLAIIDLVSSRQPMASADGRVQVVFNGEILNYRSLRNRLRYPFRTSGDTEVLLAGHFAWGEDAVRELRGQFAYGVFDGRDGSLWLFRDRLGILPLYYYVDDEQLVFASEVKALLPALPRPPEVEPASLDAYLTHRSVPAPATLFKGVRKLLPGHRLHARADGRIETTRYWRIPEEEGPPIGVREAIVRVSETLAQSVERALTADVPVGAYLSGGVDSSLIAALMTAAGHEEVHTFSAGFGDPRFDELPHARTVSRVLGTRHHEVVVTAADFQKLWHTLTWHRDAPLSEPADVAVFRLAELARRTVKVVLSGEGSDELFAGYPKYRVARAAAASRAVPASLRAPVLGRLSEALPERAERPRIALRALAAPTEAESLRTWFAPFTADERRALLGGVAPPARPALEGATPARPALEGATIDPDPAWLRGRGDSVRRMLYADCHAWLADNLLERGDRMSMAASLELRPPFLDHELVELAFALPSRLKLRRGNTKWIIKQIAAAHLPASIVNRRKSGFRVPLDAWFRAGLGEMAADMLLSSGSFVASMLDRTEIESLLDEHRRGRRNHAIRIWTLLGLEVWSEVFLTASPGIRDRPVTLAAGRPGVGAG